MLNKNFRRWQRGAGNMGIIVGVVAIIIIAALAATLVYRGGDTEPAQDAQSARDLALASEGAPTLGDPNAKVHLVEFLDPACETCALFFPMVKNWMSQVPGQIRLSVRHVAFHEGAEHAVKALEASRGQDMYWEALEALLASQREWVDHHVVQPDKIDPILEGIGLDMDKLRADMNSMAVLQRFERDKQDAILLKVSKTPDYYVNGRPLPSFGAQQLASLIREELEK